jgi:hypothetical protein
MSHQREVLVRDHVGFVDAAVRGFRFSGAS